MREQRASNLIGLHVQSGAGDVVDRLQAYGHVAGRGGVPEPAGGLALLGGVVRTNATLQSVVDGFVTVAAAAIVGLLVLSLVRTPPRGPASHVPLFPRRAQAPS